MRRKRRAKGMGQEELGRMVGADRSHISKIDSGATKPSPGLAEKIAVVLGMCEKEILYPERYPGTDPSGS